MEKYEIRPRRFPGIGKIRVRAFQPLPDPVEKQAGVNDVLLF
jgi:hypothetical protein